MFYHFTKRLIDILGSLLGLAFLSPLMLWLSHRIRREMSPPALFTQMRAGRCGTPFRLYKFRTMTAERDATGALLPDEARLTPIGRRIRATSLDELPQLWNVLKGEMSLVGPRPLLLDYVPLYDEVERRRLEVRPGITGWAQINGRNAISWQEKFALDIWYVDNANILLDIKILVITMRKAILREGISAAGEATMPRFTGKPAKDTKAESRDKAI